MERLRVGTPPGAAESTVTRTGSLSIALAATFTAELLYEPLSFWMKTLALDAHIEFAPYAQILQELLNPSSLLSRNAGGINALLIRVEDWIRDQPGGQDLEATLSHARQVGEEFLGALTTFLARSPATVLLYFAPCTPSMASEYRSGLTRIEQALAERLRALPRLYCGNHADVMSLYPLVHYFDARSDKLGHIPYTDEYFAAMATWLARRIAALSKPPYKVIAVDCDNTLWRGVCGEDGPQGVDLTPAHRRFQELLVRQHDSGVLLCLCSKNNPEDVEAVFRERPEMPLRPEHLVASCVNWRAKSENLKQLASELSLALDSFVFIDDNELECAEVRAHCGSVLTLRFPEKAEEVDHFLEHIWAFDHLEVTAEAKRRTAQYKENRARALARESSSDLEAFLDSLAVQVTVAPMSSGEITRVAELTQRTNQFNFTNIRRRASELEGAWASGELQCLVVRVSDRFGDYGLVGAVLYRAREGALEVDTFVMSCRALGRGAEHRVVNELGRIALAEHLATLVFTLRPSARNVPAREFLEANFAAFRSPESLDRPASQEACFRVPAEYGSRLLPGAAGTASAPAAAEQGGDSGPSAQASSASSPWVQSAYHLSHLPQLLAALRAPTVQDRLHEGQFIAPRNAIERAVAEIWRDILRVEAIGAFDHFFDVGGDSLRAVRVLSRIGAELGLEASLASLFDSPVLADFVGTLAAAGGSPEKIERSGTSSEAPLASSQRRHWFVDQLEAGSTAYHIPFAARLKGRLDRAALQSAIDSLLIRHESLRSVFVERDGEPLQRTTNLAHLPLECIDLRTLNPERRESELERLLSAAMEAPFDLGAGPLIRVSLLQLGDEDHVLALTLHHIISDGWSIGILISELTALYAAQMNGTASPLPALPLEYSDYARWEQRWIQGVESQKHLAYWTEHVKGAPQLLDLPTDHPRPAEQSFRGATVPLSLGADLTARLKALSRTLNATLAMTLHAAWSILLERVSRQDDIVMGVPLANRPRAELDGLIGSFANALPIRVRIDTDRTVSELIEAVRTVLLEAYAHQSVPFEPIVEALRPIRSLSYSPIFQVMFAFQNAPRGMTVMPGLEFTEIEIAPATAQFDLTLTLQETDGVVHGGLNYATDLFEHSTILGWARCFEVVLHAMAEDPTRRVSAVPLLDETERGRIISTFSAPYVARREERPIHALFEAQAHRRPDCIAAVYEGQTLTYAELNRRANQLARHLRARDVGCDDLVGICLDRSLEMLVAILGVLKAGGAYVPLDPDYPAERLAYMLEDAAPRVLLTQEHLRRTLPYLGAEVIAIDHDWAEIASWGGDDLPRSTRAAGPESLAYVIYTSGSTGKPKGVMVEHRNVTRLFATTERYFSFSESDTWTLFHSFAFDFSVWEIWGALLYGGRLVVVSYLTSRSPADFYRLLCEQRVSVLNQTPSAFTQLIAAQADYVGEKHALRLVIFGGEALELRILRPWILRNGTAQPHLVNMYGITETTVHVTYRPPLTRDEIESERGSLIGKAIPDLRVYVLDSNRQPVPVGVAGEIYVGGEGVARGYLNRAELSAQRFLPDPYQASTGARMYRSGDLARWRADGSLEYLGRNDSQVKIRGFRIELGEIEAQLTRAPGIKDAAVLAREDVPGDKRLVAYLVPDLRTPTIDDLKAHLGALLPEYMVPSAFIVLERLPLTSNGKLDRRALPAPTLEAYALRQYAPPKGPIEESIAGLWQGLLGVERVGRDDNFFALGGHSLLIIQLLSLLRRAGLSGDVRTVFSHPTVAGLAAALTSTTRHSVVPPNRIPADCTALTPQMLCMLALEQEHIDRIVESIPGGAANIEDLYPLAPLQEGILFHHLVSGGGQDAYARPILLSLRSRAALDALIEALQAVIERHDVLRTAVLWERLPRPVQVVQRRARLPVDEVELKAEASVEEQLEAWMAPEEYRLDLRQAPPIRLQVAADPKGEGWYALLKTHHLVCDNGSLATLIAEVTAHLEGRAEGLPAPTPYRNHVAAALSQAEKNEDEAFFRSKLHGIDEPTAPFGLTDVHADGSRATRVVESLAPDVAERLRTEARRAGVSPATLFHAAWAVVVSRTSAREDVVFATVLLGRVDTQAAPSSTIGMFINTLPLRLNLAGQSVQGLIQTTHRELADLLAHEQASLALAQRCSAVPGSAPLFTALINYRHTAANAEAAWPSAAGITLLRSRGGSNYPIVFSIDDLGEGFSLDMETDRQVDPQSLLDMVSTVLVSMLDALASGVERPALALPVLSDEAMHRLVHGFNAAQSPYPEHQPLHRLFEEQVARTPDKVAVVYEGVSLTYAELNSKANRLARYLKAQAVGRDETVAICVERGFDLIVALIATLKAGGAYVPLDPDYPIERLQYMLESASPRVLLTQSYLLPSLSRIAQNAIAIDGERETLFAYDDGNLSEGAVEDARALAYVIFTSGSTGKPKGVMVEHRGVVNFLTSMQRAPGIDAQDSVLAVTTICFDIAGLEIYGPLISGATLVMASRADAADPQALKRLLERHEITILQATPATWRLLLMSDWKGSARLKALCGGEALSRDLASRLHPRVASLWNLYGPTETTIWSSCREVLEPEQDTPVEPIGGPIANTQIYILDAHRNLVPMGVAGEIHIAGDGVARGYLNRPDLTAERFIADPYSTDPTARMYTTGDLGRWRPNGTIEYLGRNDHQVKIRGFRIELGEIEAELARHPGVRQAVVLAREDEPGEKRLVAYLTATDDAQLRAEALRARTQERLPDYMVPSAFVLLDQLPLTPNGKLDRRALPAPDLTAVITRVYEPPSGAVEEGVAALWCALLGVDRVGRQDNFFELGGHSLLAMNLIARVGGQFEIELPITAIFRHPALADFASLVQGAVAEVRAMRVAVPEAQPEDDFEVGSVDSLLRLSTPEKSTLAR